MSYLLSLFVFGWSFLEASVIWVAPDISISIAYVYQPRRWPWFLAVAVLGAFSGACFTYYWAQSDSASWAEQILGMPFHAPENFEKGKELLAESELSILRGAWMGVPYKFFFAAAGLSSTIGFFPLILWGILSRLIRYSIVLGFSALIHRYLKPVSEVRKGRVAILFLAVWILMILLFDVVINGLV